MTSTEVVPAENLAVLRSRLREEGRRVVLTNGCFDILHVGHLRYLEAARALGDCLVIAVNSDESVRALKGPTRPINSENDRAEILAGLKCVDYVTIFRTERVTGVIELLEPDIYAKGGDYTVESLNPEERGALEKCGAAIEILPLVAGKSTTAIIKKIG